MIDVGSWSPLVELDSSQVGLCDGDCKNEGLCEVLRTHLFCDGLGKFTGRSTGKLTNRRDTKPIIFVFKVGFIGKDICKIVGLDIEDGVNAIEARIERRL
jgi:hypothetical protein